MNAAATSVALQLDRGGLQRLEELSERLADSLAVDLGDKPEHIVPQRPSQFLLEERELSGFVRHGKPFGLELGVLLGEVAGSAHETGAIVGLRRADHHIHEPILSAAHEQVRGPAVKDAPLDPVPPVGAGLVPFQVARDDRTLDGKLGKHLLDDVERDVHQS